MAERVKFGKVDSFGQAIVRLPDRGHPNRMHDDVISDLSELKAILTGCCNDRFPTTIMARSTSLTSEGMRELERISFHRDLDKASIINWARLDEMSDWRFIFQKEAEGYARWRISEMNPKIETHALVIACIERNDYCNPWKKLEYPNFFLYDEDTDYEILLLRPMELHLFKRELSSNNFE